MSPYAKSALTFLGAGVAVAVFFVVHWVIVAGVFNHFDPVAPGVCTVLASVPGSEDFEIDATHQVMFISSTDRHAAKPAAGDGIYFMKLGAPGALPVKLAGTPADFHPHGISLYQGPGGEALFAVNHRANGGQSIEIFSVAFNGDTPTLTSTASIAGGLLVSPNDVFAVSPTQFYVTNDHVTKTALGRFAEDDLLWPHADLLYFNGMGFRIAVQRIAFPNGVFVTPDGRHLYVTATNERRLIAFSRDIFLGDLAEIGALSIPARLDNISMAANGDLVIAGHPSLVKVHDFQRDAAKPSPSAVFRVHLDANGAPKSYDTIYANDGGEIGASSSAAIRGGHLFIGSVLDKKLLDCNIK
jgi:arylesterase/paraoxonase